MSVSKGVWTGEGGGRTHKMIGLKNWETGALGEFGRRRRSDSPPTPPRFRGPGFPESARNVSPNQWISESGRKKDHLLKVFVFW